MSTAALAVGLAVTGGVAVLIASITILFCVLHKHNPNGSRTSRSMKSQTSRSPRKQVVVKSASKATEKISEFVYLINHIPDQSASSNFSLYISIINSRP